TASLDWSESQLASCGDVVTNARAGSQAHGRNEATSDVPPGGAPSSTIVTIVTGPPMIGGARVAASSPRTATARESARMAIAAAPVATTSAPLRAASGGERPHAR